MNSYDDITDKNEATEKNSREKSVLKGTTEPIITTSERENNTAEKNISENKTIEGKTANNITEQNTINDTGEGKNNTTEQSTKIETEIKAEIWKPDTLVIGSGGARGYLYLGALHRLYASGYLENVKTYIGVSVGSILCFLLGSGLTPRNIWDEVKFLHTKDLVSMSSDILKKFGLFKMDKIEKYLKDLVEPIFGNSPTFKEFFDKTNHDLHIVTSNITQRRKVVFCKDTHPNVEIIKTLCMSSSIPLLFEPYMYEKCEYNDGANYTTYPIKEIDDGKRQILGLYIEDENDDTMYSKINMILTGSWDGKRNESIQNTGANAKHIRIYSKFLDVTGVSLDVDKKIMLLSAGDASATLWTHDQENCKKEKPTYTFLRAVVDYCESEMNQKYLNARHKHYEESDEEHDIEEELKPVSKEAFYADTSYSTEYLN